ncbi:Adaptor for signal transduction [Podila verticillata]|nr:Adaptor for signal transduction [Podila verticillata]
MTPPVKAWLRDDCRRLSIDISKIQYQDLKTKLQSTFQLENDFTVKYSDVDGDLCTISGNEELEDLVNSDQVQERKATLRLQVIPKRASILNFHRRDSSDHSGISTIAPASAQNFQHLNYARTVRSKFPASNSVALLNGLDERVYRWSVDTTGQWLSSNGYEDSIQSFKDNDITGDILLDLTHDTLKDMGMHSTGRRIRLLKMIAELRLHVADLALQDVEGGPDTPESLVDEPAFDQLAIN